MSPTSKTYNVVITVQRTVDSKSTTFGHPKFLPLAEALQVVSDYANRYAKHYSVSSTLIPTR